MTTPPNNNNPMRDKVRSVLQRKAFPCDAVLAHNLELAIYNHAIAEAQREGIVRHWSCPSFCRRYTQKARSMLFNLCLAQNPQLKAKLMRGEITVQQLVEMTAQEMFPERWVDVLFDVARMANKRMAPQPGLEVQEGAFTCSRCKSKRTTYFQLQTRSADEPMTTFVTCIDCNKRWKF